MQNAIAQCYKMAQIQNLHFVVDVDITGFFDNIDHSKLIRQLWGIRSTGQKADYDNQANVKSGYSVQRYRHHTRNWYTSRWYSISATS